jgi:TDG/mug DNA glycosylase family protein
MALTREEIAAAEGRSVPDVIGPNLDVLFCGINPGLYTAAAGHNFARPGNRFWPTIHRAGFTPRVLKPEEERELLQFGCGITNIVARATASADELSLDELQHGGRELEKKVQHYAPRVLAVVGIGAYRAAFGRKQGPVGLQPHTIGTTAIWLLPNPSGLNANYSASDLAELYGQLHAWIARSH